MKFTSKFAGLAAASVLAISLPSAANAALVITFDGESGTFESPNIGAGPFSETADFSVGPVAGILAGTISSSNTGPDNNVDFTSVTINGIEFTEISAGQFEFRTFLSGSVLDPQVLVVEGMSEANGSYSGTLAFTAVPEPASWALMIGGFGLVGGSLRSRRKVATKVAYA